MGHVTDDRIGEVDQVQGAVGAELDVDRAEIAIARLQQRLGRVGGKARSLFAHLVVQHALKADDVVQR